MSAAMLQHRRNTVRSMAAAEALLGKIAVDKVLLERDLKEGVGEIQYSGASNADFVIFNPKVRR
jgi:hypothetical protein